MNEYKALMQGMLWQMHQNKVSDVVGDEWNKDEWI